MNTIEAIIMGLVQGLTEFLPISSSAHLRILGAIFGDDPGAAFTAITQIGTESAVLIYFWKDISRIVQMVPSLGARSQRRFPKRPGCADRVDDYCRFFADRNLGAARPGLD